MKRLFVSFLHSFALTYHHRDPHDSQSVSVSEKRLSNGLSRLRKMNNIIA
jgi:hypothetical protein